MANKKIIFFVFLFFLSDVFAQDSNLKKPVVVASINPIYQILLEILEDKNDAFLIIDPSFSEHEYALKKSDIEILGRANLVFFVDQNLEKNLSKISQKNFYELSKINGLKLLSQRNNPKKIDPHIWLNPENSIKIAKFMAEKICEIDQKNCVKYQKNFSKFEKKISKAETKMRAKILALKNSKYVFYHDGFQYFEDYFGLKAEKIMMSGDATELAVDNLRQFDKLAKSQQIQCVFNEARDEKNSAQKLAKNYGLKFVILDSVGKKDVAGFDVLLGGLVDDFCGCFVL